MMWVGRTRFKGIYGNAATGVVAVGPDGKPVIPRGWDGTPLLNELQIKKAEAKAAKGQRALNEVVRG